MQCVCRIWLQTQLIFDAGCTGRLRRGNFNAGGSSLVGEGDVLIGFPIGRMVELYEGRGACGVVVLRLRLLLIRVGTRIRFGTRL